MFDRFFVNAYDALNGVSRAINHSSTEPNRSNFIDKFNSAKEKLFSRNFQPTEASLGWRATGWSLIKQKQKNWRSQRTVCCAVDCFSIEQSKICLKASTDARVFVVWKSNQHEDIQHCESN